MIIGGVSWKLSGSEFWNESDELTILNEWFHWACESKRSLLVTGLFGWLKGLLSICDEVDEEMRELEVSQIEVVEIRQLSGGLSSIFETVWSGCGNSQLLVLLVILPSA